MAYEELGALQHTERDAQPRFVELRKVAPEGIRRDQRIAAGRASTQRPVDGTQVVAVSASWRSHEVSCALSPEV